MGELARATGVTVRTLHHYDAVGLLSPRRRSDAGYRLYGPEDVERLQSIRSLRSMGFPLEEIRALLDRPDVSALRVVELHLDRVRAHISLQQRLAERLEGLAAQLSARQDVAVDDFIRTLEVLAMTEKIEAYYSAEQLEWLRTRREAVGEERVREVEVEWPRLTAEMRAEYERGSDPASERVQALAARWQCLVDEFTGGNAGITDSLARMYESEPGVQQRASVDPGLMKYVGKAMAARTSQ